MNLINVKFIVNLVLQMWKRGPNSQIAGAKDSLCVCEHNYNFVILCQTYIDTVTMAHIKYEQCWNNEAWICASNPKCEPNMNDAKLL